MGKVERSTEPRLLGLTRSKGQSYGKSVWSGFALIGVMLILSGCATAKPFPSKRQGLFANLENGGKSRARTNQFGRATGRAALAEGGPRSTDLEASPTLATSKQPSRSPASTHLAMQWPLDEVVVTSRFGERSGSVHEGIDLRARIGAKVRAAEAGRVVYSGNKIRGYGRLIVIKHSDGMATVYAHHSQLLVRKGQIVKKGQLIGFSGKSGSVSGPHLHFEVRDGIHAVDPMPWLSRSGQGGPLLVSQAESAPGEDQGVATGRD